MNVTIDLPEGQWAALKEKADAQGLSVEDWLQRLAAQHLAAESIAHLQNSDPEEWGNRLQQWVDSHDPDTPVLSEAAMSRETIYPDRS